ncbi:hypothetical protein [Celeribacter naphthalenivorans]|uniref:hypothetical protein n=1 Tax=Celeribacter naphthalenivorans TaxID=1614694 RepID=UPI001CFB08A2|nr:hypothetical protein [Celeribacter naphthalenivorans]
MELCFVLGHRNVLLPKHLDTQLFENLLGAKHRVFLMPWYSRNAGRYYHERLLSVEEDRRLETAILAIEVEYQSEEIPVMIFPSALESADDAMHLQRFLSACVEKLGDSPLVVEPVVLNIGEADEDVKARLLPVKGMQYKPLRRIELKNVAPLDGRCQINMFSDKMADELVGYVRRFGLVLSRKRAQDFIVNKLDGFVTEELYFDLTADDAQLKRLSDIIFPEILHGLVNKPKRKR